MLLYSETVTTLIAMVSVLHTSVPFLETVLLRRLLLYFKEYLLVMVAMMALIKRSEMAVLIV